MSPPRTLDDLEQENAALRRAVTLLHDVSRLVHGALELEATCYAVLTGVSAGVGLGFNRAMLFLLKSPRGVLEGAMGVGPADRDEADRVWKALEAGADDLSTLYDAGLRARQASSPLDALVRRQRLPLGGGSIVARALRERRLVHAREDDDDSSGLFDLSTGLATPLIGADGPVGVLYADNTFTRQATDAVTQHVLSLVGDQAARAVENARRFEKTARAARTDALTGLGHHGALMEHLAHAVTDADSTGEPLSLVMVDLDNFKRVNDHLGHLAGDALLVGLSARLRHSLRPTETAYRFGGEEFCVVLPGAGLEAANAVAERLRRVVADEPFALSPGRAEPITCSLGVAQWRPPDAVPALVEAADRALLEAKRSGKNRVVSAAH
ncbi:MAG: sensor domain-containing diguanylate cyclase [Myxococcaceae bacterium]|nr:sensor domain-containing diguanylate cyclase [Myxococcaceae bacterium]